MDWPSKISDCPGLIGRVLRHPPRLAGDRAPALLRGLVRLAGDRALGRGESVNRVDSGDVWKPALLRGLVWPYAGNRPV